MKSIDPGELDTKITVQRQSSGATVIDSPTWATHTEPWAKREDLSSRETHEYAASAKKEAKQLTRWTVVFSSETSGITSTDRISYGGEIWDILTIRKVGLDALEILTRRSIN